MNIKEFEAAFAAEIQTWAAASFPALTVVYDNGPVPDEGSVGNVWVDCRVNWYTGTTVAMGARPRGRHRGSLSLSIFCRDGTGIAARSDILSSLEELLRNRRIGSAVLEFPHGVTPTRLYGWHKSGLLVPFYLDRD